MRLATLVSENIARLPIAIGAFHYRHGNGRSVHTVSEKRFARDLVAIGNRLRHPWRNTASSSHGVCNVAHGLCGPILVYPFAAFAGEHEAAEGTARLS